MGEASGHLQEAQTIGLRKNALPFVETLPQSVANIVQQQGKRAEAYELLAPIYGWFTEGFDTADLQEAKALLEELRT